MSIELERERLSQMKMIEYLNRDFQAHDMISVYRSDVAELHNYGIYCALIPSAKIEKSLSSTNWDLMHDQGIPGVISHYKENEMVTEYYRFGDDTGIEPLVIDRNFYEIHPDHEEICEEFRLFHRLYHDCNKNEFIKIDDAGNEDVIARIKPNHVEIRLKEIRQFLAIKEMHLSIQFDLKEFSEISLAELKLENGVTDNRKDLFCWKFSYGDSGGSVGYQAFSRLLGKRLIAPLPKEKSGFKGAEKKLKEYVNFIIGADENGEQITYTSNPEDLKYLTPVYFRKQVLDKYYHQPSKYRIEDGVLRCGSLWMLPIDNFHENMVCAWLGDLGQDLPYNEQLHWLKYNFVASEKISKIFFSRQIEAQFADSDQPEHIFQQRYSELFKACKECLGWQLLLPLGNGDKHHIHSVRVLSTDEQLDFDALTLGLTKILIDSLNEKALDRLIPENLRTEKIKGISRLETVLINCNIEGYADHIKFLRNLQDLRSSGAAHRKGKEYQKIALILGIADDQQNLRIVSRGILDKALGVLNFFIEIVRNQKLNKAGS